MTAKFTPEDVVAAYQKADLKAVARDTGLAYRDPADFYKLKAYNNCGCALGALYVARGIADCRTVSQIAEKFGVTFLAFAHGFDEDPAKTEPTEWPAGETLPTSDYDLGKACRIAVEKAGLFVEVQK